MDTFNVLPLCKFLWNGNSMMTDTALLLVEDEVLIQQMLEDALTDAGFKVVIAANGTEAMTELADDARRAASLSGRLSSAESRFRMRRPPPGWPHLCSNAPERATRCDARSELRPRLSGECHLSSLRGTRGCSQHQASATRLKSWLKRPTRILCRSKGIRF